MKNVAVGSRPLSSLVVIPRFLAPFSFLAWPPHIRLAHPQVKAVDQSEPRQPPGHVTFFSYAIHLINFRVGTHIAVQQYPDTTRETSRTHSHIGNCTAQRIRSTPGVCPVCDPWRLWRSIAFPCLDFGCDPHRRRRHAPTPCRGVPVARLHAFAHSFELILTSCRHSRSLRRAFSGE